MEEDILSFNRLKYSIQKYNIKPNKNELHYPDKHDKQLTWVEYSLRKNNSTKKSLTTLYHYNICNINLNIEFPLFIFKVTIYM